MIADALSSREYNVEVVKDYNQADYFVTYLDGDTTEDLVHDLSLKNVIGDEYENWINVGNTVKSNGGKQITIINFKTAYLLEGIEEYSDVILGGFNTYTCAIMDVLLGNCESVGVLPFTLPASSEVVAIDEQGVCASPNDVPGYDKTKYMKDGLRYEYVDELGNSYVCGYGM